jgi:hypothetical protein
VVSQSEYIQIMSNNHIAFVSVPDFIQQLSLRVRKRYWGARIAAVINDQQTRDGTAARRLGRQNAKSARFSGFRRDLDQVDNRRGSGAIGDFLVA